MVRVGLIGSAGHVEIVVSSLGYPGWPACAGKVIGRAEQKRIIDTFLKLHMSTFRSLTSDQLLTYCLSFVDYALAIHRCWFLTAFPRLACGQYLDGEC